MPLPHATSSSAAWMLAPALGDHSATTHRVHDCKSNVCRTKSNATSSSAALRRLPPPAMPDTRCRMVAQHVDVTSLRLCPEERQLPCAKHLSSCSSSCRA